MADTRSATSLARDTAQLLPAPPRAGDPTLYLAWEELVWFTARRLAEILGTELNTIPQEDAPLVPCSTVSWQTLLTLAASSRPGPRVVFERSPSRRAAGRRPATARNHRSARVPGLRRPDR